MKPLIGLGALVIFLSVPARAQMPGAAIATGSPINSMSELAVSPSLSARPFSSMPTSRPIVLRVVTVSGSKDHFTISSFVTYDQALADGIRGEHPAYVPYDRALAMATDMRAATVPATPKSLAQAAREFRGEAGPKSGVSFVQDRDGRIVKQAD